METIELSECIYEHIKDTFYYGLFGDFKLVIDKATGYFNATKLCDAGNKPFRQWKVLEKSKKMVEYYQRSWRRNNDASFLYEVKLQNNDQLNKQVTGTYVPKELILDIASWISVEFYDKCNNIIINYFVNEFKKMDKNKLQEKIKEVETLTENMTKLSLEHEAIVKVKDDRIDELAATVIRVEQSNQRLEQYVRSLGISLEEVKDQNEELLDQNNELLDCNKELKKDVKKVQCKLGIAVEDRALLPEDESKREHFVLLKRNDPEYYPYYTIRAQDSYTKRKLRSEKLNFPKLNVLLDFKCNPNSKTLYTRIKENLKAKNVIFKGNNIDLEDSEVTEEGLVEAMTSIHDSRKEV